MREREREIVFIINLSVLKRLKCQMIRWMAKFFLAKENNVIILVSVYFQQTVKL